LMWFFFPAKPRAEKKNYAQLTEQEWFTEGEISFGDE
jgi:hypothetical protein